MHCLGMLWNTEWEAGVFVSDWELENRNVIPKPGKDDYNDCNSYRTISITSRLGKQYHIISYLRLINFVKTQSNTINEVSRVNSTNSRHDNDCGETASTCLCKSCE